MFVQGKSEDHGVFMVKAWKPPFSPNYRSQYEAEMEHEQFRCCPVKPSLDCCKFYHKRTGTFCDNWGEAVDESCPTNPWPCYVLDLEEKLAQGENLRPEDLQIGYAQASYPLLIAGGILTSIGGIMVLCMCPCLKLIWRIRCIKGAAVRLNYKFALMVPDAIKTKKQKKAVWDNTAAIVIQQWWRTVRKKRRKGKGLPVPVIESETPENPDEGPAVASAVEKALEDAAEEEPDSPSSDQTKKGIFGNMIKRPGEKKKKQKNEFEQMDTGDQWLTAARFLKAVRAAEENPQVGVSIVDPPESFASPGKRLIYDTGSPVNFRKLANHRIASGPGDKKERVEVGIASWSEADELVAIMQRAGGSTADEPLTVGRIPKGSVLETMGLTQGLRLVKVGKLQYPVVTGAKLIQALVDGPKPVFLRFEGDARDYDHPLQEHWKSWSKPAPSEKVRREEISGHGAKPLHLEESPEMIQQKAFAPPGTMELSPPPPARRPDYPDRPPSPPKNAPPNVPTIEDGDALAQAAADAVSRFQVRKSRLHSASSTGSRSGKRSRPCSGPTRRTTEPCDTQNLRSMSCPLDDAGSRGKSELMRAERSWAEFAASREASAFGLNDFGAPLSRPQRVGSASRVKPAAPKALGSRGTSASSQRPSRPTSATMWGTSASSQRPSRKPL